MKTRHQKGYVYRKSGWWYVRYYDNVMQEDGSITRVQVARRIAPVCDQYRSKRAVVPLADELLLPINRGAYPPEGTMTLERFVEHTYLPHVAAQKRPSTYRGYRNLWKDCLKLCCGGIRLREFRTCDGERLLTAIAQQSEPSRNTLKHIKSLLSAIFKHAKRLGALNGINPIQDVSIPKARESGDTFAYSLEEINQMLTVLPEPAATVVATAAFLGVRKGELRGLLWENYSGSEIRVTQSIWEGFVTEPKTRKSKAPIPVIGPLATKLDGHRLTQGNPERGLIFTSGNSRPLDLNNLVQRFIKPALERAGLTWHAWHAFRRGLATNLYRLGVPDKTIQAILRHADISTTMNSYVKSVSADTVAAMRSLERVCTSMHPTSGATGARVV